MEDTEYLVVRLFTLHGMHAPEIPAPVPTAMRAGMTRGRARRGAPEMARRLVGSGWRPEYRAAEMEPISKSWRRRRGEEVMHQSGDPR